MEPAVDIKNLNFVYKYPNQPPGEPVLADVSFTLPANTVTLLIGSNGAGKSTLLQILASKKLVHQSAESYTKTLGLPVFYTQFPANTITYLGTEWVSNPITHSDLVVSHFIDSLRPPTASQTPQDEKRFDELLDILDVDLSWHMHKISDGERRRIQLLAGLMNPFKLLLMDEVTVDLDVLVRDSLLRFLKRLVKEEGVSIVYATHIFDGLDFLPDFIVRLRIGSVVGNTIEWPLSAEQRAEFGQLVGKDDIKLFDVALQWMREDKEARMKEQLHAEGAKRGRVAETGIVLDKDDFYRKYDYSK